MKGFTIIECLIVLAIVGILAAVVLNPENYGKVKVAPKGSLAEGCVNFKQESK